MEQIEHSFTPIYDEQSKILILGSIPSVVSRKYGFYYMNPQNRFWKVLSCVLKEDFPITIEAKKQMLHKHHIALWDVLSSCEIEGSKDHSIQKPIPNDISSVLKKSQISFIYTTGKTAYQLYQKYCYPITKIEAIYLPSPSSANAVKSLEQLVEIYTCILDNC